MIPSMLSINLSDMGKPRASGDDPEGLTSVAPVTS